MTRRLPTIHLPLFALLVAIVLFGHDAGMAAELHHPTPHAPAPAHGQPLASHHEVAPKPPTAEETRCVSLEVSRTSNVSPVPLDAALPAPFVDVLVDAAEAPTADAVAPGAPPGQRRALLQVWLN